MRQFLRRLKAPFKTYLTLHEAEALDNVVEETDGLAMWKLKTPTPYSLSRWRPLVFSLVGLVETLAWLSYGGFILISGPTGAWQPYQSFLITVSWLYTVVRPIERPSATPPFDLFVIYCLHFFTGIVQIGGTVFDNLVSGTPLPSIFDIVTSMMNLAIVLGLLVVLVTMPLAVPSNKVRREEIVSFFNVLCAIDSFDFSLDAYLSSLFLFRVANVISSWIGAFCFTRGLHDTVGLDHL
jgi:hypothetical protein